MMENIPQATGTTLPSNEIVSYMHCRQCLEAKPPGTSPIDWQRIEIGWTNSGLQVWCKRHQCNVIHIDFEGYKHPADMRSRTARSTDRGEHQ